MNGVRTTVYLPSRNRHGEEIDDIERWVDEACRLFCSLNGGATHLTGYGVYQAANGLLIREHTHIIYSISSGDERGISSLVAFLDRFGSITDQEMILYEIGTAHFLHTPTRKHHGFQLSARRVAANAVAASSA